MADAVAIVSALLVSVLIARFLGPTNRGVYFLVIYAATLVALVADLGLSTSGIVYATKAMASRAQMHGLAVLVSLAATILAVALVPVLQPMLSRSVLKGVSATELWFAAGGIGPLLYAQVASAMLTGLGRVPQLSIIRVWTSILTLVVTGAALWASEGSTIVALTAWVATSAALAAWIAVETVRRMGVPRWPSRPVTRGLIGFGLRSHIGTLSHHGFLRADVIFVSARFGPTYVGVYSLASLLAERVSLLGSAAYAAGAGHVGTREHADASELTARMVRVVLALLLPSAALLAVLSQPLIPLVFGSDFAPAVRPFILLLPGTVCLTVWYLISLHVIAALQRPLATTAIQGVAMLMSLPLYYIAVRHWGMSGAAVVSSAVYGAVMAAGVAIFVHATPMRAIDLLPRRRDAEDIHAILRDAWRARRSGGGR